MRVNIKSEFYPPFFVLGTIITSYILHAAIAVQVAEAETVSLPAGSDEKYADTLEIIKARGFEAQFYTIKTKGYPITLYRIINPLADQSKLNKYPVLYGHGLLHDAMSMISRSENAVPRKPALGKPTIKFGNETSGEGLNLNETSASDFSLPFMFSNNNFDVWLFDARGTNNKNHKLDAETSLMKLRKFWDFSLDDQALIDLPMLIDFVLIKTNSKKLVYVGYSQSTLFLFALLSVAPQYSDKLVAAVTLAPVAYVGHIKGMAIPILAPVDLVPDFIHYSHLPQPVIDVIDNSMRNLCSIKGLTEMICGPLVNGIGGKGVGEMAPNFFSRFFKSTSIKSLKQFIQLYVGKRFGMYDYGAAENQKRYKMSRPPAYDLSRIKSKGLIIVRGGSDILSTKEDQEILLKEMSVKPYLDINILKYNHFDFIDGKELIELCNGPIMTAVYQLMFKEGPDILKYQEQMQSSSTNAPAIRVLELKLPSSDTLRATPLQNSSSKQEMTLADLMSTHN